MATAAESRSAKRRAKKRADGEGSIRYSEARGLWIGRVMVGYRPDGKPDVREVKSKLQSECKRKLDEIKAQTRNRTLPSADTAGMTVSTFLDRWLATVKPNLREKTYRGYSQHTEVHFKPALGKKRLVRLSHDDIQAFLNAKRDEKRKRGKREVSLSPRSLHSLYVVLGTALNWAVKKGYIPFSPMLRVDAPRVPTTEITPLTLDQTRTLLATAKESADPLYALWMLAASTGARKAELLGLMWGDIDLQAATLTIRPNAIRDVKTPRSRRTLDITTDALDALAAHRDRQAVDRQALGAGYGSSNAVFASEVGTPLDHDNVTKRFKQAVKRAGLPPTTRMHDLRHGAATHLLEDGETVPTVSAMLGHASPVVTMGTYAHAVPGSRKRASDRLGALLRGVRKDAESGQTAPSAAS